MQFANPSFKTSAQAAPHCGRGAPDVLPELEIEMSKHAMITIGLLLLPWQLGCTQGNDTSRASQGAPPATPGMASADSAVTATGTVAIDSQAIRFMPMMWMHLDSMGAWSPAQMQQMMTAHQQMAGRMMQMMGPRGMMGSNGMMGPGMGISPGSPWSALRDSIQGDLSVMPGLSGKDLVARRQAHIDRMRRMMVMGMGMMGGGGWATMPGGCGPGSRNGCGPCMAECPVRW